MDTEKHNPYEILGVAPSASEDEIRRAYRSIARTHHPDKTRGQPTEDHSRGVFELAKAAAQLLGDADARAAYDKVLALREAAKRRNEARDAAQRDARSRLEQREQTARRAQREMEEASRALQAQIVRLRAENEARLQAERERPAAQPQQQQQAPPPASYEIKVRWNGAAYSAEELQRLFAKYGPVSVLLSRKSGRALLSFQHREDAALALQCERGYGGRPFSKLAWATEAQEEEQEDRGDSPAQRPAPEAAERLVEAVTLSDAAFEAYETAVLAKLRRAQRERERERDSEPQPVE